MNEEIKFYCQNCGEDFDICPDMMVEAGPGFEDNEGEEWKGAAQEVDFGAVCLCLKCQDKLLGEEE